MAMASTNNLVPAPALRLSSLVPVSDLILHPSMFVLMPLKVKLGHCGLHRDELQVIMRIDAEQCTKVAARCRRVFSRRVVATGCGPAR